MYKRQPLSRAVDGRPRNIGEYQTLKMGLYEWDDEEKFRHIVELSLIHI